MMDRVILLKEKIIKRFGLEDCAPEELEPLFADIEEVLSAKFSVAILEKLSPVEQQEFLSLIESEEKEEVVRWLATKIKNIDQLLERLFEDQIEKIASVVGR